MYYKAYPLFFFRFYKRSYLKFTNIFVYFDNAINITGWFEVTCVNYPKITIYCRLLAFRKDDRIL